MVGEFLSVLEQLSEGVQVFSADGWLLYANQMAARILGYDSSEALWMAYREGVAQEAITFRDADGVLLAPSDYPCVQVLQGAIWQNRQLHIVDSQGCDRCLAVKTLPIRGETGEILYGVVIIQDQTELHTAQQAITQTTQKLHQVTNAVPSLIACIDLCECHQYANDAYLQFFGETLDTICGKELQQVLGGVLYHQIQKGLQQALAGEVTELCLPILSPGQPVKYKHITLLPQQDADKVVGMFLVFNDITAHKYTTDLLQNEANFFRHALEAASVGIWDWNLVSDEIMWSSPQEKLFGLTPGTFDGRSETFFSLVDPRDQDKIRAALSRVPHRGNAFVVEFRVWLPDGRMRWLSHRGQVFFDQAGQAVRVAGVAFDITQQKAAEEKLLAQVKRDSIIAKISQTISRSQNIVEVLPQVLREVRLFLGVDRLIILDLQVTADGEVTFEDHSPEVESMLAWKLRHTWAVKKPFMEKYRQGHPVAVTNIKEIRLSPAEVAFLEFFEITADLTFPLLDNNQVWGLLSAHHRLPRDWTLDERRLLETLATQIGIAMQRDRLHRHLTRANEKLKRFAYLDGLTKVANRRRFEDFLGHEWRRLMREQAPLSLIMADIDYFKAYNDIYGHQAGDECLRRVAGILRSAVQRPADLVARYGGEEFAIILPNTDAEGAETVAQKIQSLVHQHKIPHQGSPRGKHVTISMGIAMIFPHPLRSPDDLILAADKGLYQAKEAGRDTIVVYTAASHQAGSFGNPLGEEER